MAIDGHGDQEGQNERKALQHERFGADCTYWFRRRVASFGVGSTGFDGKEKLMASGKISRSPSWQWPGSATARGADC